MPLPLQRAKMMREPVLLGFALNHEGRFEDAEKVLREVIDEFGPSSETNALLGRIYKDRWRAMAKPDPRQAEILPGSANPPPARSARTPIIGITRP